MMIDKKRQDRTTKNRLIIYGDLVIDLLKYEVRQAGRTITLTLKEYELLRLLASNPGRVFTRETLLYKIWGSNSYGGARTIDVHITRLRNKIKEGDNYCIETVRGVGYKFKESK